MEDRPELVGKEVIYQSGCYMRVRRYYRGFHPQLGKYHLGLTGIETVEEADVIRPINVYHAAA